MECRFSNGGHQLAIASGNLIMVYATYTCELLGNLRSHPHICSCFCASLLQGAR